MKKIFNEKFSKINKDFIEQEQESIKKNVQDFDNLVTSEQDYDLELLELAEEISLKLNKLSEFKTAQAELKFSEEQFKSAAMEDAKEEGIKLLTERKNYARRKLNDTKLNKDKRDISKHIISLEMELKGLDYKFKAIRSAMEFQTNMRKN